MPSGKKARQQRQQAAAALRTPPPVRSKGVGGGRGRQASPRALAIGGGVVLIVVIAIVLGVVLSGGNGGGGGLVPSSDIEGFGSTGNAASQVALPGAAEANNLFKGIPQHGLTVGNPRAKVEMDMFIDVQCPFCQAYETSSLPTIIRKYVKSGKVQLHLKPWAFISAQSFTGRLGLIAASFQNKSFEYAKVLYDNQPPNSEGTGWLDSKMMANIAASVTGLDLGQWRDDTNSSAPKQIATQVDDLAKTDKVRGTPTVLVGRTNGKLTSVAPPSDLPSLQQTEHALDAALANA